jgi:phosphoglycolate phosphatase-like HAD superfamily hydrolase
VTTGLDRDGWVPEEWRTFRRGGDRPVVAVDIDGTMGNYHRHFLWFAELYFGRSFPDSREVNPGMRLSTFMGISHREYRECKLAYRQGGLKRFMPCYPGAGRMTAEVRAAGAELWVCTTRPYLRLDNIDPDTREWLHRNKILYDAVIFDGLPDEEDPEAHGKYRELTYQVPPGNIVAAVDDLPEQIHAAKASGIGRLYIRDQPYNSYEEMPAIRVHNMPELTRNLLQDIHEWKARNA